VRLGDPLDDCQTEAGAAPVLAVVVPARTRRVRAKEPVEDARQILRADADAGVRDRQCDAVVRESVRTRTVTLPPLRL
jgi:hypothetical protein